MQLENYLNKMIQNNVFAVVKKHSKTASAFKFTIAVTAGACALLSYYREPFEWCNLLIASLICIIYAADFLFGIDHLQLVVPDAGEPLKLFRIGDDYFVGSSLEEANLFAALQNKHNIFIEEFENSVYIFEQ